MSSQYPVGEFHRWEAANEAQCQLLGKQNPGYGEKISNPVMSLRNKTYGFTNHGVLHIEGLATNAIGRHILDR